MKNKNPVFTSASAATSWGVCASGVFQYKTFFSSPEGDNDTNLPPAAVLSAAVTFSKSTALVPGGHPQRRRWRRGDGTKLQDKSFPLEPGGAQQKRRKEKRNSCRSSSVSHTLELLPLCCSFTPSATSTTAGARLRLPRLVSLPKQIRAGVQGCAIVRGAVRSRDRKQVATSVRVKAFHSARRVAGCRQMLNCAAGWLLQAGLVVHSPHRESFVDTPHICCFTLFLTTFANYKHARDCSYLNYIVQRKPRDTKSIPELTLVLNRNWPLSWKLAEENQLPDSVKLYMALIG